jgi:hypothetical protein
MAEKRISFAELEKLIRFLGDIRDRHAASLERYYNKAGNGFLHMAGDPPRKHPSKSSTATCINSLVATSKWSAPSPTPWIWERNIRKMYDKNLTGKWKSGGLKHKNAFTVAFVLEAALDLESVEPNLKKVRRKNRSEACRILRTAIEPGHVHLTDYPPSAYLTQLVWRVLKRAQLVNDAVADLVFKWATYEIVYQQALFQSGSKTADPYQLCYSIILAADTIDPDMLSPDNKILIAKALDGFFQRQLPDGTWPRSQSLFHYPHLGNAHCYEYELLSQLLATKGLRDLLLRHIDGLSKAAYALHATAFQVKGNYSWSSGHHPQKPQPESWTTASVFLFAYRLDRLLAEAVRIEIFSELGEQYREPGVPQNAQAKFAADFLDCPIKYEGSRRSLRRLLFKGFVQPIARDANLVAEGGRLQNDTPMSAIFFGPPGTSKTELTRLISEYLSWPLLSVDPSYFIKEGIDLIQAQANKLFQMLEFCERTVVLLDEFDEMVRDRANTEEAFSRFITTAMLPKLATINKKRRIVFIVATNFINLFDRAISRQGRFELLVQVMPPIWQQKLKRWKELRVYKTREAQEKVADLTFLECKALVKKLEADDLDQPNDVLEKHFKDCTLSSTNKSGDGTAQTWRETCASEAKLVRLPP